MITNNQLIRHLGGILPASTERRLILLTGARQVGKTTLVRAGYGELRYVNLDGMEEREALRGIPAARWADDVGAAILDEAQKEPSVFEKVKYAYDAGRVDFTVLLGSAQILMMERVRETLAGRVFVHELWPLTVAELAAQGSVPARPLLVRLLEAPREFRELLRGEPSRLLGEAEATRLAAAGHIGEWGGMPALLGLRDDDRRRWLRSYHDTYLQRDLTDLARLRDLEPFVRFQRLAALRTGQLLSFAELARDAGTSAATARGYLEYLRISYQAFLLQPYRENLTSATVKTPKLYWSDLGIVRHLSSNWGPLGGALFETAVVGEATKLVRTFGLEVEPSFYRTRSGMEVDLVLPVAGGLLAFEVKARETAVPSDVRSLRALVDVLGPRFLGGAIVTSGGGVVPLTDDGVLWQIPFHRLFT
ncbi:MAG: ATP-binding protein [Deltaproteobacteria bacterium]|nr:ATP-binding protein [Deltaproteobacteria bacterium]